MSVITLGIYFNGMASEVHLFCLVKRLIKFRAGLEAIQFQYGYVPENIRY